MPYTKTFVIQHDQIIRTNERGLSRQRGFHRFVRAAFLLVFASAVLVPPVASADEQPSQVSITPRPSRRSIQLNSRPAGALRLDVNLVLIPVLVTDLYDRPVQGLHKEDFRLLEDG